MLAVSFGGRDLAIYDIGGQVYATDNLCTHAYAQLTDGTLEGGVVECPLHGGRFDLRTGAALWSPAFVPVSTYEVRVEADDVLLDPKPRRPSS